MLERLASYLLESTQVVHSESPVMRNSSLCQRICEFPHMILGLDTGRGRAANLQPLNLEGSASSQTPLERLQKEELQNLFKLYCDEKSLQKKQKAQKEAASKDVAQRYNDAEAGKECDICNTHFKTHFAVSCGHSACVTCWSRWLIHNPNCMVCQTKVTQIQRYPFSLVPKKLYETESHSDAGKSESSKHDLSLVAFQVDESLERVLRSLLDVKDAFSDVVNKLETVEGHLYALTRPESGTTVDALASVLAVECVTVTEVITAYKSIFTKRASSSSASWKALEAEIDKLQLCVDQAFAWLKKTQTIVPGAEGGPQPINSQEGLEELEKSLQAIVAPTSIVGQWENVKQLVHKCSNNHHLVPGILSVFGLIQATSSNIMESGTGTLSESTRKVVDLANKSKNALDAKLTTLLRQTVPKVIEQVAASKTKDSREPEAKPTSAIATS